MVNFKIPKRKWVEVTDEACLIQFKYQDGTIIYVYEGKEDPNLTMSTPDTQTDCYMLTDGRKSHVTMLDKKFENTIGSLWVWAERSINITIKEFLRC